MHDLKFIRENPDAFDAAMKMRGLEPQASVILSLDESRRSAQTRMQDMQSRRNTVSKEVGQRKAKGEDADDLIAEVQALKDGLAQAETEEREHAEKLDGLLCSLPNLPFEDVPFGADEDDNVEIRKVGNPKPFSFDAKEHFELGEALGLMDFETAATMSGARFVILKGALARLERALANFMLDTHTGMNGYTEAIPPFLVRDNAVFGTGQLPKFSEDLFHTDNGFWLIPTAEVPLTNTAAEKIWDETDLPMRYTAWTPCFRSEAGAAGKDTRGMIRQHQFSKVEMVSIVHPDKSEEEHERMTACAEGILQALGLPYRTVVLCTGDMGFGARKTYDIEVWLPGQDRYREISSCSNCGDFQARRMKARFRSAGEKGTRFVHTLNGSGLAVGRTLIAVLENYQNADGTITVPEALRGYMGGIEVIGAAG
ncbi:serine--tRNA ligase [Rhodospirillaceae bacterium KN72]|uniref:Serine--tRNA ligase n=1 Tax=Pacificispira spongiicola TaxID=2729598 RepID=A0A7Y0DYR3_9PROT|nr:serine--tRNA ligase [Pacificispira spongiicola]NMM44087.1 serine--tRNA ligase [Pacificispira spongiicola]